MQEEDGWELGMAGKTSLGSEGLRYLEQPV